jgi:hypothetical protein
MVKVIPDAHIHSDDLEWRPWDEQRKMPFVAQGPTGQAWVKVLSRDPETEAESLLYRLDPGWAAEAIENTVYENLLVLDGELEVDGQTLAKYWFSYRPEGHRAGPVSTKGGVTVIAFAGFPGELASNIPVPYLDTNAMDWSGSATSSLKGLKVLRADEENLDCFSLTRAGAGWENDFVAFHDTPEEVFILQGKGMNYDGATQGRHINTAGTYVHRGIGSLHGMNTIVEDNLAFQHDYFNHGSVFRRDEATGHVLVSALTKGDLILRSFPRETAAVRAVKEGRVPELPTRW